jgi:hypothetical protein
MQTTLRIDDELYRKAKSEAARQGVTITRYIEEALKLRLRQGGVRGAGRVVLPTFAAGKGFSYSPEELKALAQRTEATADRAKAPVKRRR